MSASVKHGVDSALIYAVICAESKFKADAISPKGAVGLMQIMPSTAKWLAEIRGMDVIEAENIYKPCVNIDFGTFYLAYLLKKYGNYKFAIAAYNAGEGVTDKWLTADENLSQIPYNETRKYVNKVMKYYKKYLLYN